jgi:hypothetical protein
VPQFKQEMEFTKDARENWTKYTITAQRTGFQPAQIVITWTDANPNYTLNMQPMRKDLAIITTPPGAAVSIDGEAVGVSPLIDHDRAFNYDIDANEYVPRKVHVTKPGYDPVDSTISWDDGKADYQIDLKPKTKSVKINTDPAGAVVTIDGTPVPAGDDGVPTTTLAYVPTDEKGDLPTYVATISKKTDETEWYPTTMPIGWDDGKTSYSATLKEVKTRPVALLSVSMVRNSDGIWEVSPRESMTIAMKDTSESPGKEPPTRVYVAPPGVSIGTLTVSPTGTQVLFTTLSGTKSDFRSQIFAISADGVGGVQEVTNGKALDLMPSYSPDGDGIVFSSNRAGRRLNIWRKSLSGGQGIEQLTNGQEQDIWPMIDAGPKPRLFYEALSDSLADGQLYCGQVEGGLPTNLLSTVSEPRISPKADAVVFTRVNERTGNREIYRVSDKGGDATNLTNDPDSDCYDPVYSKDGNMIAYVSDRGLDEDRHRNADIWIIDLAHPDQPIQVTTNGSVDDSPAWDPTGTAIYFRSNRGGAWGIWRVSVK